jgi:hypothetical protein
MKIIEGTSQEISEYLNRSKEQESLPFDARNKRAFNQFVWRDQTKKHGKHWSHSKLQWVEISDMNSSYITNVLRKMLRENKSEDLLKDDEFQSLVINLADKIVDGE